MSRLKTFASDNYAGVHPEIIEALAKANDGHAVSYGEDPITLRTTSLFRDLLGDSIEVIFVYNGTGANVLGLSALTNSFNSVICADCAHIAVDESTAPEKFTGTRLSTIPSPNGKITADKVQEKIHRIGDQHHPQAKVISISQSTEFGTVYTADEIKALSSVARENNLFMHMDGARICNAAVSLNKDFGSFTRDAGIDVLSFGGAKNGMMFGEAIVFFNKDLARNARFIRKQGMQLHSKMRFITAQFEALLSNDLWKKSASHSNEMAAFLASELSKTEGVTINQKVDANGIFASVPAHVIPALQKDFPFYVWNAKTNEIRLMCSWDTKKSEVEAFIARLKELI